MVVRRDRPLANDHLEGPASCKWSSGSTSLPQMIIRRAGLLQMIIRFNQILLRFSFYSSANSFFSSDKHHLLLQNISPSSSNLRSKARSRGPFENNVFSFYWLTSTSFKLLGFRIYILAGASHITDGSEYGESQCWFSFYNVTVNIEMMEWDI